MLHTARSTREHRALGAKLVAVRRLGHAAAVHAACSTSIAPAAKHAVVFDVSHLGTRRVRGPGRVRDAAVGCSRTTSAGSSPGRAQYTHLLDPADAHVVDDIIVWWVEPERFFVMPNASNTDRLLERAARRERGTGGRASRTSPRRASCSRCRARRRGRCSRPCRADAAAVPRFDVRVRWASGSSPARATRARTASRSTSPRADAPDAVGRARPAPASRRPVSARATRCGSKPGCRCTVTSWGRASRRCRPASAGSCGGTRATFRGRDALAPSGNVAGPAPVARGLAVAGRRPGREGAVVLHDGRRRRRRHERQLLADARPRDRASRSCRRRSSRASRSRSTSEASRCRPTVVKPPFVRR